MRATPAPSRRPSQTDVTELPLLYPVTTELPKHAPAYCGKIACFLSTHCAIAVAAHLDAQRSVAVICEGDPLFYGSYMHLHVRLAAHYPTEVIAGVTGMSGCWSAAGAPIARATMCSWCCPARWRKPSLPAASPMPTPPW